jgi:hypothetical protein
MLLQSGEKVTRFFLAQEPRLFNRLALIVSTRLLSKRSCLSHKTYIPRKSDICQMLKEEVVLIS